MVRTFEYGFVLLSFLKNTGSAAKDLPYTAADNDFIKGFIENDVGVVVSYVVHSGDISVPVPVAKSNGKGSFISRLQNLKRPLHVTSCVHSPKRLETCRVFCRES